jgi:putative ABC transport system permease protein
VRGILLIVRRSLRQHAVSTGITIASAALASGLVMAVFSIQQQSEYAFVGGDSGFDAVIGARGSQLQLVLNAIFHLETSPGNIPWAMYEELKNDERVKSAIPYATGDSYRGFRIVGTTLELFGEEGANVGVTEGGYLFEEGYAEAVVGSFVSQVTGLGVGDHFNPTHGVAEEGGHEHSEEYTVVGVLEPTNSPLDRVVFIPIEGIFRMGGHVLRGTGDEVYEAHAGEEIPDEHKEVSAVLLKFRNPTAGFQLDMRINKQGKVATLAYPIGTVMADLFNKMGWINRVLELVAYLVVAVSAGAILASIYNTINERRREFAILRALGARRATVFSAIVAESAVIAGLGALFGFLVYGAILGAAAYVVRQQTGVVLDVLAFHPVFVLTPMGMIALGAVAGVVPATKAYATDVADNLVPQT